MPSPNRCCKVFACDRRRSDARRRPVDHRFLDARHRQRRHGDLLAVEMRRAIAGREHVDVVADEVLALACGVAAAADRHAEAREDERTRERPHGVRGRRASSASGASSSAGSSAASSANGARRKGVPSKCCDSDQSACAVDRQSESPSPARIMRAGAAANTSRSMNTPSGERRRQRLLVAVHGDRRVRRRVPVHRRRGREHDVGLALAARPRTCTDR